MIPALLLFGIHLILIEKVALAITFDSKDLFVLCNCALIKFKSSHKLLQNVFCTVSNTATYFSILNVPFFLSNQF